MKRQAFQIGVPSGALRGGGPRTSTQVDAERKPGDEVLSVRTCSSASAPRAGLLGQSCLPGVNFSFTRSATHPISVIEPSLSQSNEPVLKASLCCSAKV